MGGQVVKVDLIAVPWDSGARGVRMGAGPEHLIEIGIVEALERSGADVSVHMIEPDTNVFDGEIKTAFEIQRLVAERVAFARSSDRFPIILSGNCNTAVGTVAGMTHTSGSPPAVCWLDAHGDFNTPETTPSGFLDGMAVAMLAGLCWKGMTSRIPGFTPVPENQIVMTGLRALDPLEETNIEKSELKRVAIADAAAAIASTSAEEVYMHVDLDVFDTSVGSANGFAVGGGLTRADFIRFAAQIRERSNVGACALTAYDPAYDTDNRIGRLAVDIAREMATGQAFG